MSSEFYQEGVQLQMKFNPYHFLQSQSKLNKYNKTLCAKLIRKINQQQKPFKYNFVSHLQCSPQKSGHKPLTIQEISNCLKNEKEKKHETQNQSQGKPKFDRKRHSRRQKSYKLSIILNCDQEQSQAQTKPIFRKQIKKHSRLQQEWPVSKQQYYNISCPRSAIRFPINKEFK